MAPQWGVSTKANIIMSINSGNPPEVPEGYTWIREINGSPIGLLLALTRAKTYQLCTFLGNSIRTITYE